MSIKTKLDDIDRKILSILQKNGRITNADLAAQVGISPPPCLRRLKKLEQSGIIKGYHADLDWEILGNRFESFAYIGLNRQNSSDLDTFENNAANLPEVVECYMLSGEIDFLLKIQTSDLKSFQHFVTHTLTEIENVKSVKTSICVKNSFTKQRDI